MNRVTSVDQVRADHRRLRDISSRNDEEKLLNTKVQLSGETRTFYVLETGRSIARWKGIYMVSGEWSGAGRRKIFRPATRREMVPVTVFLVVWR